MIMPINIWDEETEEQGLLNNGHLANCGVRIWTFEDSL